MEVSRHTPFIVGHTPMDGENTYWLDVGDIKFHHILFSANPAKVGLFLRVAKQMLPFSLAAEPLLDILADQQASIGAEAPEQATPASEEVK